MTWSVNPQAKKFTIFSHLSEKVSGQTDSQVVASCGKLNFRRLALSGQTDRQVSSQVHASHKKTHFKADISCTSLANNRLMDVTQLALTRLRGQAVKNLL